MSSPEGQVAIVTGASRGIGRSCAEVLARSGMCVVLAARSVDAVERIAEQLRAEGHEAAAVGCDVDDREACERLVATTIEAFGRVDVLVANAGVETSRTVVRSDPDAWIGTIWTNTIGAYLTARPVVQAMKDAGGGQVLFVGSGAGHSVVPGMSAYGASKAAVSYLSAALSQEVWRYGISVNELVPGPVATEMTKDLFEPGTAPEHLPSERVKEPEEVASFVLDLLRLGPAGPTGQIFSLARRPL